MENNERDRKLEQWLDEALSQYSAAEPRLGLEQRVLAQVRAEEQARAGRRNWWRWMPAFAAIAAVLIVAVAVRPYFDQKLPKRELATKPQPPNSQDAKVAAELKSADSYAAERDASAAPMKANSAAKESRRDVARLEAKPAEPAMIGKREAAVREEPSRARLAAASPQTIGNLATADAPSSNASVTADSRLAKQASPGARQYQNIYSAPAASPAMAGAAPSSSEAMGVVTRGRVNVSKDASAGNTQAAKEGSIAGNETINVETAAQSDEAPRGYALNDKVAARPDAAKMKAMKVHANPKGPLAKKLEENVDTVNVVGLGTLRTDLKTVPAGPIQKFPTPAPLSKEEQALLDAAKQMKNEPAKEEKQQKTDGENNAIEIKKIEIAPLPGPPK